MECVCPPKGCEVAENNFCMGGEQRGPSCECNQI